MIKKFLLLLIILTATHCSYQPIFSKQDESKFKFKQIVISGDNQIGKKIISLTSIKKDDAKSSSKVIILESILNIEETSRDSKGDVATYRSTLTVHLSIKNNDKFVKKKTFTQSSNYSAEENKFDLVKKQNEIKNNIIEKTVEEIILYINLE
jgi:hypothetical protein